jgi:NAD(P)-dependent dehydrogenase (short-subunit alcohol dehydrogenase family)
VTYLDTLFSLKDRVAIITGASRGNGQAIAQGFVEAGATVYNIDIIKGKNLDIKFLHCDITNDQELCNNINHIFEEEGRIDILVNNAGITRSSYSDQDWDDTYAVNLRAPFVLSRLVLKYMKKAGTGSIINITSLNSELAFPDNPSYVAFKGALKQLTKSIALDFGEHNIRANNLGPGYIKTKMTEKSWRNEKSNEARKNKTALKRWGHPEDLVGAAIFLASNASNYVTGQDIYVDGGWLIKGL